MRFSLTALGFKYLSPLVLLCATATGYAERRRRFLFYPKLPQVGTPLTRYDMKVRGKVDTVEMIFMFFVVSFRFIGVLTFELGNKAESRSHTSPTRSSHLTQ